MRLNNFSEAIQPFRSLAYLSSNDAVCLSQKRRATGNAILPNHGGCPSARHTFNEVTHNTLFEGNAP